MLPITVVWSIYTYYLYILYCNTSMVSINSEREYYCMSISYLLYINAVVILLVLLLLVTSVVIIISLLYILIAILFIVHVSY